MVQKLDVRLCVGSLLGPRSSTWRIFSTKSDIYVSAGKPAMAKLSFHQSGICRDAFTKEHGIPNTMSDRVIRRWHRALIPPPKSGRACLLLRIWTATDFLSSAIAPPTKKTTWISPATSGNGRAIELMLSADDEPEIWRQLIEHYQLIAYALLPDGNSAIVATRLVTGSHKNFYMPASHHQKRALIISANDPENTGRPVRFHYGTNPKDGDCKVIWELAGYYTDAPIPVGLDTFNRSAVLATQDTPTVKSP